MTDRDVLHILQAAPRLQPDLRWKDRTKERLLAAYDRWNNGLRALRHWALYVSAANEPSAIADAIIARGHGWRPVAIHPERVGDALRSIEPALVVVDSGLAQCDQLVAEVKMRANVVVLTDQEILSGRAA